MSNPSEWQKGELYIHERGDVVCRYLGEGRGQIVATDHAIWTKYGDSFNMASDKWRAYDPAKERLQVRESVQ